MIQCCITAGCPRRSDEGQAHWPVTACVFSQHHAALAGSINCNGFF